MSTTRQAFGTAGVIAFSLCLGGCVIAVGNRGYPSGPNNERYYVQDDEMVSLVSTNKHLELGMDRDDALALYPPELTTLMASAKVDDRIIEEWRVQAYEGSRKNVRTTFHRWLYFADGTLVRFSEERIDFANHPSVVQGW